MHLQAHSVAQIMAKIRAEALLCNVTAGSPVNFAYWATGPDYSYCRLLCA